MKKTMLILMAGILAGGYGTAIHAAKPEPSAQEAPRAQPRKSKRLAPPCADEPADQNKAGKKKAG